MEGYVVFAMIVAVAIYIEHTIAKYELGEPSFYEMFIKGK
jgi:hypothetical protein